MLDKEKRIQDFVDAFDRVFVDQREVTSDDIFILFMTAQKAITPGNAKQGLLWSDVAKIIKQTTGELVTEEVWKKMTKNTGG